VHRLLTRFINYYNKQGALVTFYRILEHPYRILFKNQAILHYVEMNEVDDSVLNLPNNVVIESRRSYSETLQPDMQKMSNYWHESKTISTTKERFKGGAILWIVKVNGDIAAFVWSIRGKVIHPWFFPLTPHDAYIFDAETFEEYRGHGLYPLLMNYILGKLKLDGVSRVVAEPYEWNTTSIRALEKTHFRKFGKARKFHLFRRNITIWSNTEESIEIK